MNATVTPFECGAAEGAAGWMGPVLRRPRFSAIRSRACSRVARRPVRTSTARIRRSLLCPLDRCLRRWSHGGTHAPAFNGTFLLGNSCSDVICFSRALLHDRRVRSWCQPRACTAFGGSFQGDGTDCDTVDVPLQRVGAVLIRQAASGFDEETCLAFGEHMGRRRFHLLGCRCLRRDRSMSRRSRW